MLQVFVVVCPRFFISLTRLLIKEGSLVIAGKLRRSNVVLRLFDDDLGRSLLDLDLLHFLAILIFH